MKRLAVMGSLRLSGALIRWGREDLIKSYPQILLNEPIETIEEKLKGIENTGSFDPKKPSDKRILSLLNFCYESPLALVVLELCSLYFQFPECGEIFKNIPGGSGSGVTLRMAAEILGWDVPFSCYDKMEKVHDVMRFLLEKNTDSGNDFSKEAFYFDKRLVSFICSDKRVPDSQFKTYGSFYEATDYKKAIYGFSDSADKLQNSLMSLMKMGMDSEDFSKRQLHVLISGEKESGRLLHARFAAHKLGIDLFSVDFSFLLNHHDPGKVLDKALRECILTDACLVIRDITKDPSTEVLIREISKAYSILGCRPLFLLVRPDVKPAYTLDGSIVSFDIPSPDHNAAKMLWEGFLTESGIYQNKLLKKKTPLFDIDEISSKLTLSPGQIERTVSLLATNVMIDKKTLDNFDVFKAAYQILDDGRYANIKRIKSGYTVDDLKVPENVKNVLSDICDQANHRKQVYDTWGMREKFRYGRCISAIFAGPPGTGKTMAVHTLSSSLGLELYKVDLSQVVDKYIGETEKRLEEIFTRAEKSNMILFFDEADAVMGKRSETQDSKDKYSNTEIAYILQRIEEYDGIVILATNFLQNIDVAFMRRIRYVLYFPMPDEATRKLIWQSSFSDKTPLSGDIDYDFLAEKFELSGGSIKNIVLNATFYAASEKESVAMRHIIKAVYRENSKDNRINSFADYGCYGIYATD